MQSRNTAPRLLMFALAAVSAAIIAACATAVQQEIANVPPTSVDTLSYYPFQVKGYQNSYPRRRVLVLMPLDSRDFKSLAFGSVTFWNVSFRCVKVLIRRR